MVGHIILRDICYIYLNNIEPINLGYMILNSIKYAPLNILRL